MLAWIFDMPNPRKELVLPTIVIFNWLSSTLTLVGRVTNMKTSRHLNLGLGSLWMDVTKMSKKGTKWQLYYGA